MYRHPHEDALFLRSETVYSSDFSSVIRLWNGTSWLSKFWRYLCCAKHRSSAALLKTAAVSALPGGEPFPWEWAPCFHVSVLGKLWMRLAIFYFLLTVSREKWLFFSIIKVYIIQHDLNSETVPTKWIGLFFLRPKRWHPHLNIPTEWINMLTKRHQLLSSLEHFRT